MRIGNKYYKIRYENCFIEDGLLYVDVVTHDIVNNEYVELYDEFLNYGYYTIVPTLEILYQILETRIK